MAYEPPVTPNVVFNFVTTPYTPPQTPAVNFELTVDDDDGGAGLLDPRMVQTFVIT